MNDRNDPCSCGSGKKTKRCFGANDPSCELYRKVNRKKILEEHNGREKEVIEFFKAVMEESNQVFLNETDGRNRIPLRVQMIVAFSTIDMLGSYWFEYLGKTGKTNERAQAWYERFCSVKENEYYKGLLLDVSSERLYKFRNALVHFFGLGDVSREEIYIALVANDLSNEKKEEMETAFLKKNHKSILLRPKDFFDLIREGALLMLQHWAEVIAQAQSNRKIEREYIDGIERVWTKIQREGAKGMSREALGVA